MRADPPVSLSRAAAIVGVGHTDYADDYRESREADRLQHCAACDRWSWPAVAACEHCGHSGLRWDRVSGRGTLLSWCTSDYLLPVFGPAET